MSTPTPCSSPARSARRTRIRRYRGRPPQPQGQLRQAGTESAGRERLGDFYLYPLPERTTIANAQTKQVSFLDVHGTPAPARLRISQRLARHSDEPQSANTVLRFSTSRDQGLGDALPAGTVRVYQRDARGNPQFVGESAVGHTPMGSEIGLTTGQAFDVKVQPTVVARERYHRGSVARDRPLPDLDDRPHDHRRAGERHASEHYWQTQMRYTADQRAAAAGLGQPLPVGPRH